MDKSETEQDVMGPVAAYHEILIPAVASALERAPQYGDMWREHALTVPTALEAAKHTIDVHVQARLAMAIHQLDYGDFDGFVAQLGSAVGYMAVAIAKARYKRQLGCR